MPRSPKAQGELVEIRFLLEATSHGLEVSKPWGDNLPYDFLVGRKGRYHRVQVKSSATPHCRGYHVSCFRPAGHRSYRPGEVDFLAAYIGPEEAWYVIPVRAFAPRKTLTVFPRQRPTRGGRFERFRDAWHLLRR